MDTGVVDTAAVETGVLETITDKVEEMEKKRHEMLLKSAKKLFRIVELTVWKTNTHSLFNAFFGLKAHAHGIREGEKLSKLE